MKRDIAKGILHKNIDLKPFTSWHIGGQAEYLYWPKDLADLQTFLPTIEQNKPITYLGLGSNVLIKDAGVKGVVIIVQGALTRLEVNENKVIVGAGHSCAKVARFAAHNNLVGGEFLAGIPGTIGGALFMNAGAFGGETWACIDSVRLIRRSGQIITKRAEDFDIHYRYINGLSDDEWFISGTFSFMEGDGKKSLADIKALLAKRSLTQPTGEPSCGSVFKNPPGEFAAELIESLGLKGFAIGGAQVSEKHANFIINEGGATAKDILTIISEIKRLVKEQFNIMLQAEVKVVG